METLQTEVQKIHHQYGVSEKANYEIQKLFDKAIKEAVTEALRIHDAVGRREQLIAFAKWLAHEEEYGKDGAIGTVDAYLENN